SAFLHVKPTGQPAFRSSIGAVVYRIDNDTVKDDIFLGWYTPYAGDNLALLEVKKEGHWTGRSPQWELKKMDKVVEKYKHKQNYFDSSSPPHSNFAFEWNVSINQSASPLITATVFLKQ